jgi:hypothetical protein
MSGWRAATMAKEEILRGGCMLRRPLEAQRRARGPPVEQIDAVHFFEAGEVGDAHALALSSRKI